MVSVSIVKETPNWVHAPNRALGTTRGPEASGTTATSSSHSARVWIPKVFRVLAVLGPTAALNFMSTGTQLYSGEERTYSRMASWSFP